tara:strand:- start:2677 stop:3354 length:678 start_codon:yes stop_codon:yes gene_type:complete
MSEIILTGKIREPGRKGPARKLRRNGLVPGIIYGRGDQVAVSVDSKQIIKIMDVKGGVNNILNSKIDGDSKERKVMIKDISVHPMTDQILHIDFIEIDSSKPIKTKVKLEFIGVPKGVKEQGGQLNVNIKAVRVEALPGDVPSAIALPVDDIELGQVVRISDLKVEDKLKIIEKPEATILSVSVPKVEEIEPETEEAGEELEDTKSEDTKPEDTKTPNNEPSSEG